MTQKQDDRAGILDDLFDEAQLAQAAKNPKHRKTADPSLRDSLDAAAKRMRELYTLPENWTAARGIALIDQQTKTLIGNFREYIHRTVPSTRKLLREHQPIEINLVEEVSGYLGTEMEFRLRGKTWEIEHRIKADLWLDEIMVGSPAVQLLVKTKLGAIIRAELVAPTQFASDSGATLLQLPAGTNVWEALSHDMKTQVRKAVVL